MGSKKKILFYPILSSGHINVSVSIGSILLNNHSDRVEVYFIVDKQWQDNISKIDARFKFCVYDFHEQNGELRLVKLIDELEKCLTMSLEEKSSFIWSMFTQDPTIKEVDMKAEKLINQVQPDLVLVDQCWTLPSLANVPYAFIVSASPLIFALDDYPLLGSDARMDEKEKIRKFRDQFVNCKQNISSYLHRQFEERGKKYEKDLPIDLPLSEHFSLYSFPLEIDYYDEKVREQHRLWQIDSPLFKERIPKPFEPPEHFASLPGKIIYLSLGSGFSAYTHLLQRLVDSLDKLPYKYIVSKGPNGDRLKFPSSKFIGENYLNQLAVLQITDLMLGHGGNNSVGECFYFGVPSIIFPIIGDQITNSVRLEETGYGYRMDVMKFTFDELKEKINEILNDENLINKLKTTSKRIQSENRIYSVVDKIVDYVERL